MLYLKCIFLGKGLICTNGFRKRTLSQKTTINQSINNRNIFKFLKPSEDRCPSYCISSYYNYINTNTQARFSVKICKIWNHRNVQLLLDPTQQTYFNTFNYMLITCLISLISFKIANHTEMCELKSSIPSCPLSCFYSHYLRITVNNLLHIPLDLFSCTHKCCIYPHR